MKINYNVHLKWTMILFKLMMDFENICRLCLQSAGSMLDIFASYGEKSMQQQIFCITGLATKKGDGLPSKICYRCRHVVEQACELRELANKSSRILARSVLNGSTGNNHKDDDADTIIENYANSDQTDVEGTIIEDYNICQETINMTQDNSETIGTMEVNKSVKLAVIRKRVNNPGKKPPPELICQICLDRFATTEEVRTHVEKHYTGSDLEIYLDITRRPYKCSFCDEEQLNRSQLVRHHRRHLGVNPYACKQPGCGYVGKDRDGIRHHRAVHQPASRACDHCAAVFRRRPDLVAHALRTHPRVDPAARALVCSLCGLRCGSEPALHRHLRAHHFAPRFPCEYGSCSRAFRSRRALVAHARAHRGERLHRCPLCNDNCTSTTSFTQHIEQHKQSRVHKCVECPASFEQAEALRRHRLAHHGPRLPHHGPRLPHHGPRLPQRPTPCHQGYQSETPLDKHQETCEGQRQSLAYEEQANEQTNTHHPMETGELAMQVWEDDIEQEVKTEVYIETERPNGSDEEC